MTTQTATKLVRLLADGEITSVELTKSYLDRIERHDGQVKAFLRSRSGGGLDPGRRDRPSPQSW